jgi:hypothetical protein
MTPHPNQMIDLLEIYHARSLRDRLRKELVRLDSDDGVLPGTDPERRAEIREVYETMLAMSDGLLFLLGDAVD